LAGFKSRIEFALNTHPSDFIGNEMISALFSVLLLASDAAAAAPAPVAPAAAEAPKEERKICKREMDTTSRMGSKKICMTAAEWKARDSGNATRGLGDVAK